MGCLRILLPILLGGATAHIITIDPERATVDPSETPAPTNMPFAVDSMIECLIDPGCDMSMSATAARSHAAFVTTTTINGNPMTVTVEDAGPSGFVVDMVDNHHHKMNCSAPDTLPITLTCDAAAESVHHHTHVEKVDPWKRTTLIAVIVCAVLASLLLGALAIICLGVLCGRRRSRRHPDRSSTDLPSEKVTEITKTTQSTSGRTLGRTAEQGRALAPFAGVAAAGAAAGNAGQASRTGGTQQGAGSGASQKGAGAGQAAGQGGAASGAANGGGQVGQGGGQGVATATDQGGSEVVDTGSVRGRRTLRGANKSQSIA